MFFKNFLYSVKVIQSFRAEAVRDVGERSDES